MKGYLGKYQDMGVHLCYARRQTAISGYML